MKINQRVIKFRAWHKEQKKMYSPEEMGKDQLTLMPNNRGFANIHSVHTKLSQIDNYKTMIPMQYTGLKDKNGKELFEGDIVQPYQGKMKALVAFIKYLDTGFCMAQEEDDQKMDCIWYYDFKIIGNIYENKNLIK